MAVVAPSLTLLLYRKTNNACLTCNKWVGAPPYIISRGLTAQSRSGYSSQCPITNYRCIAALVTSVSDAEVNNNDVSIAESSDYYHWHWQRT